MKGELTVELGTRVASRYRVVRQQITCRRSLKIWEVPNHKAKTEKTVYSYWGRSEGKYKQPPIVGIYVGIRFYQNGYTIWSGEGNEWQATEYVKIALIAVHPRHNPIPVLYSDMGILEEA